MGHKEEQLASYQVLLYQRDELPQIYVNFILSKWLRSYRYGNDYIKLIDSDCYYRGYQGYIKRLLNSQGRIRLAVLSDDHDVALGFSLIQSIPEGNILHYVYVHKDVRRQGIGKALVPIEIKEFTHLTKTGMKLWATKMPEAIFNPFH